VIINTNHKKFEGTLVGKEGTVLSITSNGWVKLQVRRRVAAVVAAAAAVAHWRQQQYQLTYVCRQQQQCARQQQIVCQQLPN
jgi:hypothetical protein